MNTNFNMSSRKAVLRVVRCIVADAGLGATCGGLYGFVFGGIGALAQHEPQRLIAITGVFALCGAIAGIALGAYGAFSNADDPSADSSSSGSNVVATDKVPVTAVRQPSATAYRRPQSSHVAV
jgi:hypothetical protein